MSKQYPDGFTVIIAGEGRNTTTRQLRVGPRTLRWGRRVLLAAFLLGVGLFASGAVAVGRHGEYAGAVASNARLRHDFYQLQKRTKLFEAQLAQLREQTSELRAVAGLPPVADERSEPDADALTKRFHDGDWEGAIDQLFLRLNQLAVLASEAESEIKSNRALLDATPTIRPARGPITSMYARSRLHPVYGRWRSHEGIDIGAPASSPIFAAASGVVQFVGPDGGYGNLIEIDHGHGYRTRYAHASKILVRRGQTVIRGEKIGLVGSTGLATGPHLHYEVLRNGQHLNPRNFMLD